MQEQQAATASLDFIDPLERPLEYGAGVLLADLRNVRHLEGRGPDIRPELVAALENSDYAAAEYHMSPLKDWFARDDRYSVIEAGTVPVNVPLLVAEAPNVTDLELTASQASTVAAGGEVALKVAGTGIGASANISVSDSLKLTCAAAERIMASVEVPVHWERRSRPDNADINWLHTEVSRSETSLPVKFQQVDTLGDARTLSSLQFDVRRGGTKPAGISKSFEHEVGADFSFGVTLGAIGLDTSLKVTAAASLTTELEASLPTGHRYQIAWLGGPWGVQVSTIG